METKVFISLTKQELEALIVDCVNSCLKNNNKKIDVEPEDIFMNIKEASDFLHLAVTTIYSKCRMRQLPFKKVSKRLYFSKKELTDYLKGQR